MRTQGYGRTGPPAAGVPYLAAYPPLDQRAPVLMDRSASKCIYFIKFLSNSKFLYKTNELGASVIALFMIGKKA